MLGVAQMASYSIKLYILAFSIIYLLVLHFETFHAKSRILEVGTCSKIHNVPKESLLRGHLSIKETDRNALQYE